MINPKILYKAGYPVVGINIPSSEGPNPAPISKKIKKVAVARPNRSGDAIVIAMV